jgi:hypothetical protein
MADAPRTELVFHRYWPARRPGDLDRGYAIAPRRRRLFWLIPLLGPLVVLGYLAYRPGDLAGLWGGMFIALVLTMAAIAASALKAGEDRTGVYEVDAEGRAVRLITKGLPRELRRDRGVTLGAFKESVRARKAPQPPR